MRKTQMLIDIILPLFSDMKLPILRSNWFVPQAVHWINRAKGVLQQLLRLDPVSSMGEVLLRIASEPSEVPADLCETATVMYACVRTLIQLPDLYHLLLVCQN